MTAKDKIKAITGKEAEAETILQRTVVLTLQCQLLGNERKVELSEVELRATRTKKELDVDMEELKMTKQLLNREVLQPIRYIYFCAKLWLRAHSVNGHRVFGEGSYLVPLAMVDKVVAKLKEFRQEITDAVDEMAEHYFAAVEERRKVLGQLFNENDYLRTKQAVRDQFRFGWKFVSFEAPNNLKSVSQALYEQAQEDYTAQLSDAFSEYTRGLRQMASDVLNELMVRLEPGADGKAKSLRGTALDDLFDLFKKFPTLDVGNDAALQKEMERVKKVSKGLSVQTLKDDPSVREAMLETVKKVAKKIDALVETTSGRAISFGSLK